MIKSSELFVPSKFLPIVFLILVLTLSPSYVSKSSRGHIFPDVAGILRHDRDIELYRELGSQPEFACVGRYSASEDSEDYATGVLIAPNWVLTAAHFVQDSSVWWFKDSTYQSIQVVKHPGLSTLSEGRKAQWDGWDMALVRLNRPVVHIEPATLYSGRNELGAKIVKVGYGYIGDGIVGMNPSFTQERLGGENTIDAIGGSIAGIDLGKDVLACDFDGPNSQHANYLGSSFPLDLEIGGSKGDSGGGAFIRQNGAWQLAGIVSGGVSREVTYGSVILLARVSSASSWIDSIIK